MKSLLFVFAFVFLSVATPVQAVDLSPEQVKIAQDIFGNTMSPFCPGKLLEDCPSSAASELKDKIRARIVGGESEESINKYLFSVYGDAMRAAPKTSGFGLVAWLAPAVFLVLGLMIFMVWVKKNGDANQPEKQKAPVTEWESEIDKEISG